jgi:SAM-dependent methyltransferase
VLDRAVEYQKMAQSEASMWWYRALHGLVVGALEASFGGRRDIAVLDVGCGTGGLLMALARAGYTSLRGFDLSEHAVRASCERGLRVERVDAKDAGITAGPESVDAIVLNDVIYFLPVESWPAILSTYRAALRPGGILIINAPALEAFRGLHDVAVGIGQRLRRGDLRRLFDPADFQVRSQRYWPFLLSPLIYATRLKQRLELALRSDVPVESDVSLPAPWLNALLYGVTRLEMGLPFAPWWGSSLFAVLARRPRPVT